MAKRKARPKKKSIVEIVRPHILKVAVGLSSLGAVGTGGLAYSKGDTIDVKVAKVEERLVTVKEDTEEAKSHIHEHDRALNRLDRRTTRMEVQQDLMLDALRVPVSKRPEHPMGPEE